MTQTSTPDVIAQNVIARGELRNERDDNAFGLVGLDHFALPTLDVDLMVHFVREVLGGELIYAAGFDDADRELGRQKHVFMRIGNTLMQFATPNDGKLKIGRDDPNAWPHWAFTVSAAGLEQNIERLRGLGIPVFGPVTHRGYEGAVSAYFLSPEGHKLELITYEDFPEEKVLGVSGSREAGRPSWPSLYYDWPASV